jgi:hypothetical protein
MSSYYIIETCGPLHIMSVCISFIYFPFLHMGAK